MASRYFNWIAGGLFFTAVLICSSYAEPDPFDEGGRVNEKMVAAAQATLDATRAVYEVGGASLEDVYRWSRWVMEADQFSPLSVKKHTELMEQLHRVALAKMKVAAVGGEEHIVHATEYYLAEAESIGE